MSNRKDTMKYILDTGPTDATGGIDALIEEAARTNPSFIIPNDKLADEETSQEESIKVTAERTCEFLERFENTDIDSTVLIPIQPPYKKHYEYLELEYPRQANYGYFCLGGMKSAGPVEQIEALYEFRETAGWYPYVHALGHGGTETHVREYRKCPGLVDSFDFRTPGDYITNAKIADRRWNSIDFDLPRGESSSTTCSVYAVGMLLHLAHQLSPLHSPDEGEGYYSKYEVEKFGEPQSPHLEFHPEIDEEQASFRAFSEG